MALLSPTIIAVAAALVLLARVVLRLTSPLARLPGPTVSKVTSLWLKYKELRAERTAYIHSLHKRYGPVVRVAPDEVSFTSWPAVKEIYCSGGSGYDKTEFYDLFKIFGIRTMFTTLNKADHATRKRILADRYANSNVMKSVSAEGIQERSRRFVERCTAVPGTAADVYVTLHAYACDCITHHLFHPHGTDALRNQVDEDMMHQVASDNSLQNRLISYYSPTLHSLFGGVLALFAKPRMTPLANNYVLKTAKCPDPAPFTLMSRLEEKSKELTMTDMAAECLDHMTAGIDTTGDGLCFLMWELSQPRSLEIQRRLSEEVREGIARGTPIDQLPFLDAVVCEGLRCFPSIPMSLPRYVPADGRLIDETFIPEHTKVSCQALSVHMVNTDVFPRPEVFNPDRWLVQGGDAERRRLMFAFSNGGRGCVGKHLAMLEMKTLLRDVYAQCRTVPHVSMKAEDMVMADDLVSTRPAGGRCLLHFERLDSYSS
ncbi:hypothetical protein VHEMI01534 [[Torrubiella] hemipterigena]|uniref:Cytochrome P450 n=1 Tax=[Torrubiella] hemipterigena TaxID=1531966 RepID=A0A0A1SM64_9HYPO|nr:hypothetical protein VHEMI01534 [[Torrubiella] hemipterigena]